MLLALAFMLTVQQLFAQSKQVSGVVNDAFGPVIGASVVEKGTTNGVITDLEGNFKLTVSGENATLQISYVGYQTQEIPVAGKTSFNILMKEDSEMLEEV
ncbi:carboxypeptidase-like regulatory domain-containing protein, partial [Bacteroides heparinolyticus]